MASTSTYLNFSNYTEEAFNFYKSVFGGEFRGPGFFRFGDVPPMPNAPAMSDELKKLVMHVELEILGGHVLMGTDAPEEMGFTINKGNNVHIMLQPDSKEETKALFDKLKVEGNVTQELQDMFWGDYYGACIDKYGVSWMFNCSNKNNA